jgi:hypothetical protein
LAEKKLLETHNAGGSEILDKILYTQATQEPDREKLIKEFYEALEAACISSFQTSRVTKTTSKHKPVPRWSEEFTIMR